MSTGRLESQSTTMRPTGSPTNQSSKVRKLVAVLTFLFISHIVLNAGAGTHDSANALLSRTVTVGSRFEIDVSKIQIYNEFKEKPIVTVNVGCKWKKLKVVNSQKEFNGGVKKLICEVVDTIPVGTYDLKITGKAKDVHPAGTDDWKPAGRKVSVTFPEALTVAPLSIDSIFPENRRRPDHSHRQILRQQTAENLVAV